MSPCLQVWGCNDATATRWFTAGCRSLDDVRARERAGQLHLTDRQRVGLAYHEEFEVGLSIYCKADWTAQ